MEISEKKFERLVTAKAYLTIVVELHNRGKDYMANDVLDIISTYMVSEDGTDTANKIKLGNGEAELC